MNLSEFVVEQIRHIPNTKSLYLGEWKEIARTIASDWWERNNAAREKIRCNFESVLQCDFSPYEADFLQGYADHYAEKMFIHGDMALIKDHLQQITADRNILDEICKKTMVQRKNVLMMTLHMGGVELIPTAMKLLGLPSAVIANYKTDRMKQGHMRNAKDLNIELIPANGNIARKLIAFRRDPKSLMLVCDAFDYWKRDTASSQMKLFSQHCVLDQGMDRLAALLQADVYWMYMKRESGDRYQFEIKQVTRDNGAYIVPVMKEWQTLIEQSPAEYYEWLGINGLFPASTEGGRHVPVS